MLPTKGSDAGYELGYGTYGYEPDPTTVKRVKLRK
jgi:hypothetical protein